MTSYNYPVLTWEDAEGGCSAALVEFPDVAAFGETIDDVLMQLKELLLWQMQHTPWLVNAPDFLTPEIFTVKVPVRPEYKVETGHADGWTRDVPPWMGAPPDLTPPAWKKEKKKRARVYPASDRLPLPIIAVRGKQESGLFACSIPMLEIGFYSPQRETLRDLVVHYVQDALAGLTPRALTRLLPPRAVRLESIVVRWPGPRVRVADPDLPALSATSMPIGDPGYRRSFMRSHGRTRELEILRARLTEDRTSLMLVGVSGVGKTSLLVDAVRSIERRPGETDEDTVRARRRFWMTSAGRLIAGMRYLGQWQERCEAIISQLATIKGVLCVERLLDIVRVGGAGPADSIAAFLAPYVERGELRMVVEGTPQELDACRRLLPGFVDLFRVVKLEPFPSSQEPLVLGAVAQALERSLHVDVADAVPSTVARLFRRFAPYEGFPGRAVAFLRDLMTEREGAPRAAGDTVTVVESVERFSRHTGLPEVFLRDDATLDENEVRARFAAEVIGQEDACEATTRLVMTFKAGMHDVERPLGVLLFCGPTGVGKTEMARALSRLFFGSARGDDERLVRLDMSEYAGFDAADRLLGMEGEEPGALISRVRQQPFSVVLLDEIEKADPEIFDMLLGVFDDGRLSDVYGRVTTFRSTILVMTSNLGADALRTIGFTSRGDPSYEAEAMQFFRPEFFNRLDAVVRFNPLSPAHVRGIAAKELEAIPRREGLAAARISLRWTPAVLDRVVAEGYDARYGARPLQRVVDTRVVTPLARLLAARPTLSDCELLLDISANGEVTVTEVR